MIKCTKNCFSKQKAKDAIISFLKIYPFVWLTLKTIYKNTFVQVLIFLLIGVTLLWYGEKSKNQTFTTVAITIISASLFKFFISANAFTTVISKVVRESFVDMEFLRYFQDKKLTDTTKLLIKEVNERKFTGISENLSKHILSMIESDAGYNESLEIIIDDRVEDANKITTSRYKVHRVTYKPENIKSEITFSHKDHGYCVKKFTLNQDDISEDVKKNVDISSDELVVRYEVAMQSLENHIEIVEQYSDTDTSHVIFFNKITSNVKVTYKHDDNIINPNILTRYGEIKESRSKNGELFIDFGDKIFVKDEFLFIKFNLK